MHDSRKRPKGGRVSIRHVQNIYSLYLGDYPRIINQISDQSGGSSCQDFGFLCISVLLYARMGDLFHTIQVRPDCI